MNNQETQQADYIKMDYTLPTPEERVKKVEEIIANTPPERLSNVYLEKMANYIIEIVEKNERKERIKSSIVERSDVLTENRKGRINTRETSFEGLIGKLENGEDGIYNMITNDKNIIFQHKAPITEEDLAGIPELKALHDEIVKLEEEIKHVRGKHAYALRKQLIEMRKDQYVIRSAYQKPIHNKNNIKSLTKIDLGEIITVNEDGHVESTGIINFYNPVHISLLLCNYSKIKEDCWERVNGDMKWMMEDLDNLIEKTLKEKYPLLYDLMIYKIDGKSNAEIQELLTLEHGVKYSIEHISQLWRNKIPKLIAETAENDFLVWNYTFREKGKWKRCSCCKQIKLAHNNFFSRNKTSRDGFYSICKDCRKKKAKEAKK